MEESLAREMANLKINDERTQREAEMIFAQSDELKALKAQIEHAKLNKHRSAQISEAQFRQQIEIVTTLPFFSYYFFFTYFVIKPFASLFVGTWCTYRSILSPPQGDWRLNAPWTWPKETWRSPC